MKSKAFFRIIALLSISLTLVANSSLATAKSEDRRSHNRNEQRISQPQREVQRESQRVGVRDRSADEKNRTIAPHAPEAEHETELCENEHSDSNHQLLLSVGSNGLAHEQDDDCESHSDTSTPIEIEKRVPITLNAPSIAACASNASLSWTASTLPGYARVDLYRIQYSSDNGITWINFETQTATTSIDVTGLTSGLTYIFRVAAHNVNGWGLWSTASAGCTTNSATVTTYGFSLDGLTTVPAPDTNVPVVGILPIVFLAYQSDLGPEFRTVGSINLDSGVIVKGTYTYDLYIALPPRLNPYTFAVTGGGYTLNSLGLVGTVGSGHPAALTALAGVGYALYETYAFTITSGTNIAIVINP